MNTQENNKSKEEFNEWSLLHNFRLTEEPVKSWFNETNFINHYKEDWNELMRVVEKIESVGRGTMIIISNKTIIINTSDKYINEPKSIQETISTTKIQAVYNACVEFIKWYNQQKI